MADSEPVPILVRLPKKPQPDRPADAERPPKKHKSGEHKKKRHKDREGEKKVKGEKDLLKKEKSKEGEQDLPKKDKSKDGENDPAKTVKKEHEHKKKRPREGEQEGPLKKKKKHSKDKLHGPGQATRTEEKMQNGALPKKDAQQNPTAEPVAKEQPVRSNERSGQDSEQDEAPPTTTAMDDIIGRLQKKDSYQIFAEPVDANAVPDYHDVIKNPMDFSTMKKRLAKGLYRTWDDFQAHIELMFDNAQKYNSPDTIFFKTARSMQEASRKMIDLARSNLGAGQRKRQVASRFKEEPASEPRKKPYSGWGGRRIKGQKLASIPGVSQLGMSVEELARLGVKRFGKDDLRQAWSEANDGEDVPGYRKTKEFWGPRDGRLPLASAEYKRSSYRARELPLLGHGPKPSAPGGQAHVLVPTGWQPNYAYARSLCRFAAHLPDPVWAKVAVKVQRVLPPGVKFGRGWVGEEEKPSGGKTPKIVNVLASTVLKSAAPARPTVGVSSASLLIAKPLPNPTSGTPVLTRPVQRTVPPVQASASDTPSGPLPSLAAPRASLVVVPPQKEDAEEDQPIGLIYNATPRGASPTPFGRPQSASGSQSDLKSMSAGVPEQKAGVLQPIPTAGEAAQMESTVEKASLGGAEVQKHTGADVEAPGVVTVRQATSSLPTTQDSSQVVSGAPPDPSQPRNEQQLQADVISLPSTQAPACQTGRGLSGEGREANELAESSNPGVMSQEMAGGSLPHGEARPSDGLESTQGQAIGGASVEGKELDAPNTVRASEVQRESASAPPREERPTRLGSPEDLQGPVLGARLDEPSPSAGPAEQGASELSHPPTPSAQPEEEQVVGRQSSHPSSKANEQSEVVLQQPSAMSQSAEPQSSSHSPGLLRAEHSAKQDAVEPPPEHMSRQIHTPAPEDGRDVQNGELGGQARLEAGERDEAGEHSREDRPEVSALEGAGPEEEGKQREGDGESPPNEVVVDLAGVTQLRGGGLEEPLPDRSEAAAKVGDAQADQREGPLVAWRGDALPERPTEPHSSSSAPHLSEPNSRDDQLPLRAVNAQWLSLPSHPLSSAESAPSTPTFPPFAAAPPPGSPSLTHQARSPSTSASHGSERGVSVEPLAGFGSPLSMQSYSPGRFVPAAASSLATKGGLPRERASSIDTYDTDPTRQ